MLPSPQPKIYLLAGLTSLGLGMGLPSFSVALPIAAPSPVLSDTVVAQQTPARQRQVQVFFPVYPDAQEDFTRVVAVQRSTANTGVARFAIEQLIAGPTAREQQRGLRSVLRLQGESNCGQNFTLAITNKTARLQFCRAVLSNGVGDDARMRSAIEATLKQFSTVDRVIILDRDGNCLGDQSGENRCLVAS